MQWQLPHLTNDCIVCVIGQTIKIFITNYTAADGCQQRKEGAKSVLITLFP